ncbi:hypothetical protein FGO68_gene5394 [Halteria grandinella]|uniref:Lysozyme n=1 Tax=Halteria grandinella TaxID=5974 RepID=A0A8J8NR65_HALGN|nr:hypothetical protein FGO68_gene5394 [Halteria grandinella]
MNTRNQQKLIIIIIVFGLSNLSSTYSYRYLKKSTQQLIIQLNNPQTNFQLMKFAYMTLTVVGLLTITLNSSTAEAQGLAFLGRELDSKSEKRYGKNKKEDNDDSDDDNDDDLSDNDNDDNLSDNDNDDDYRNDINHDNDDCDDDNDGDHRYGNHEQCKKCNGTIDGYTSSNGTYINCTFGNDTLSNSTSFESNSSSNSNDTSSSNSNDNSSSNLTILSADIRKSTNSDDRKKKSQTSFVWSAENVTALIKSVQAPIFTSLLVNGSKKNYMIGYGHTGKDVKVNQTIDQTQADAILVKDLKKAMECISDSIWKKNKAVLTDYQNTALVSFAQSVNCDIIEKFSKKIVLTDATTANEYFVNLIAKADTVTSDYLTQRRAAEKALFGIV